MKLLLDRLPCTKNFMKLKQEYHKRHGLESPKVKGIASPIVMRNIRDQYHTQNLNPLKLNLTPCDSRDGSLIGKLGHST
jgi:hypothetical protein